MSAFSPPKRTSCIAANSFASIFYQVILNRLANQGNSKWQLERAIWRAGELKIHELVMAIALEITLMVSWWVFVQTTQALR